MIPDFVQQVLAPDRWPTFALITARISGLMMTGPLWSMTAMPRTVRAAITVLLAVLLLPITPRVALPEHVLDLPLPVVMEMLIGIVIGLTAAVLVQGVALAGEVVSLQMGLSLGATLAPSPDVQTSGIAQIKSTLALLIFLGVGGHLILLRGLADSLRALPPGTGMDIASGAQAGAALMGTLFSSAARAAAPVMVTLLLVNVALALLSRAVPQLNAMMVSLPVTFGIGLVMIGVSLPIIASVIGGWMQALPVGVDTVVDHFRSIP
jgi:flagellar biosynthetic protein FliR